MLNHYRVLALVEAAQIKHIPQPIQGAYGEKYAISLEGASETIAVSAEWLQASDAAAGGMVLRYADGSLGYVTSEAFTEGYEAAVPHIHDHAAYSGPVNLPEAVETVPEVTADEPAAAVS